MIQIHFFLDDDLEPSAPVLTTERRGNVRIGLSRKLFKRQRAADDLNAAVAGVLETNRWFQLWRGQIIASSVPLPSTPALQLLGAAACPMLGDYSKPARPAPQRPQLTSRYTLEDLPPGVTVDVRQGPGRADLYLSKRLYPPEGAWALDQAAEKFLAGRQWFQIWDGEIVAS